MECSDIIVVCVIVSREVFKAAFLRIERRAYTKCKKRKVGIINYGGGDAEFFEDEDGRVYSLVNMRDVWDIPYIGSTNRERMGYGTQKPLALLERIINASCPEGGLALDPFAVAAQR